MDFLPDLRDNHLLAALPDAELRRLAPQMRLVALQPGQVLYESGSTISHAYFPTTTLVSTLYEFDDGTSAETAITGNEGMVGIAVFMGGDSRLGRAVVLTAGHAFRLGAQALKDEFERTGPLMHLLVALHTGTDHADGADGGVQSTPFTGPATVPLAAVEPGSLARRRHRDHAASDCPHAWGAT